MKATKQLLVMPASNADSPALSAQLVPTSAHCVVQTRPFSQTAPVFARMASSRTWIQDPVHSVMTRVLHVIAQLHARRAQMVSGLAIQFVFSVRRTNS